MRIQQQQEDIQMSLEQRNMEGGASGSSSSPVTPAVSGYNAAQQNTNLVGKGVPDYYAALEGQIPGYSTALTNAANQAFGSTTGAGANLFAQYAPMLNGLTNALGGQNLQSNANSLANTVNSPAASGIVSGYQNLQQQLNPSYGTTLGGLNSLMTNQNPNALSGSESAQIERGLNQLNYSQGNSGVANPLTNINNALTFGSGLQQKQANYANLASSTANTANTLNGGNTGFGLATNQTSGSSSPNTAANPSQFLVNPNNTLGVGTTAGQTGLTAANQIGNAYNTGNAASAGQQHSDSSSVNAGVGCCFITILGNTSMPWYLRSVRDVGYINNPGMEDGYKMMAQYIVPLMNVALICWLVNKFMVSPLAEHAGYIVSERGCRSRAIYYKFWSTVWTKMGKIKKGVA